MSQRFAGYLDNVFKLKPSSELLVLQVKLNITKSKKFCWTFFTNFIQSHQKLSGQIFNGLSASIQWEQSWYKGQTLIYIDNKYALHWIIHWYHIKYALGGEPGPRAVLLRPPPLWYTFLDPPWTAPESVSIIYCHHHKPFEEPPWTAPILIIVVVIKIVIVVVSSLSSSRSPISTLSSIPSYPDWLGWQSWPPLDTFLSPGFKIKDCPRSESRSQKTTVTCLIVNPPSSTLRKSSDAARGTWKHIYW